MKCSQCGHENRTGAKFCEECGAPLAPACTSCGAQLSPSAKFCSECGHPAGQPAPPTSRSSPRFDTPEAYTPKHLAEKILTSKAALEGERKQVTVLFADVKSSMELFADRDPEEARKLLDPVIEEMMEAVHRYEGTVNHVLGDGIVALFGAPLAHEDHAVRACYAALRMQETVKRYAEGVLRSEGVPIQIRVGLNSGEVVVRSIGSDLRMDYTVVGQTTNVAARMERMAVPGSILIPADTLALAEGYVQVKPLGPLKIKGLDGPLEVYEVTGGSTVRSRLHAAAARGLTRFVGRSSELDQLRQALERARSGHGQIVAVVGEPGVGKSRLYWEFTRSHRTEGWLIVESSSVSYGKATGFLPIIDLLRAYFQVEAGADGRKVREKLTGKLLSLDRALEPSLPALLWLLDAPGDDPQWQQLDPPQRRRRALEGVKRLLLRESQEQPLLVLFEDLHWIDAETQALLDSLVESLPTARLLLLVNYRPEYQHNWSGKTYYQQIRIDPLPPESAEELLKALLGNDASLQPLKRLLIERTEGNPFFLEESVRTLIETKVLAGERGAYHLSKASQDLQIPATAQAILAARIDRLAPEDKRLLQAASVIGKDVPFALLQSIAELSEEDLRRGLAHLQAAEFLYEARLFPELEYTFKHALSHDVTYASLLQDRRRNLHAQIAETIERLYPDRLAEHIDRLAHHASRGELWGKALTYLRQAGAKAFARSASREALAYFEQAIRALAHLPETRETLEQAIDIRFELRTALLPLAEFGRIEGYLREAEILARKLDDQRRLGWVSAYMSGSQLGTGGQATSVLASAQRVQKIAEMLDDIPLQVAGRYFMISARHLSGDYRGTEEVCRTLTEALQADLTFERFGLPVFPAVWAHAYLARSLAERGMFDDGESHGREAIRIAEALHHPFSLVFALVGLAYLNSLRCEWTQAAGLLEPALGQCRDLNITIWTPIVMSCLGRVHAGSGRIEEGVSLLEQALTAHESADIGYCHSMSVVQLGEAYLLADRVEDARACADRALMLARQRGERGYEAWALRLLGEIASHPDRADAVMAELHYNATFAIASELGMCPLVANCHLGLGKLRQCGAKQEQVFEHLSTATTMFREMGMMVWREQAERELHQLGQA
ncbi:MAG TPA: adenylate/guanylate cyclase domain-containing protein [Geminicoccaceae bacterium]